MTSNNIANRVFPARNLPGSAETWGREIEDAIKRLDGGITIISSGMGNLERGVSGQFATSAQHEAQIAYAESLADRARVSADGKSTVWRSPEMPEGTDHAVGDTWFDESENNKIYTWDGEKWEDVFLGFDAFSQDVNSKIDDAFSTAFEARDDALQAQASADGKNSVHYGSVAPPGTNHKIWDTWFDSSNGNRINEWNGSAWVPAEIGTNAIGNNAITNAKIANLDAAKITTGTLDANRIGANSIDATKLLIQGANLVPNPTFETLTGWTVGGGLNPSLSTTTRGRAVYFGRSVSGERTLTSQEIYVAGETTYTVGGLVLHQAGSPIPEIRLEVIPVNSSGVDQTPVVVATHGGSSAQWTSIYGQYTVPSSSYRSIRFRFVAGATTATTGNDYLVQPRIVQAAVGEMIVDGAITANSAIIADGAIGNAKIADAAITNAKIHDATIQYAKIGSVDAGTISVGTLDAARIAANSISAAKISGGDFAGKTFSGGIFTGSTFRTAASGARTEMAGTGVTVYDSSNQAQVQMGQGISSGLAVRNGSDMIPLGPHVFGMYFQRYTTTHSVPKASSSGTWGAAAQSSAWGPVRTQTGNLAVYVGYMQDHAQAGQHTAGPLFVRVTIRRAGQTTVLGQFTIDVDSSYGLVVPGSSSNDFTGYTHFTIMQGLPKNVDLEFVNYVYCYTQSPAQPNSRFGVRQLLAYPV